MMIESVEKNQFNPDWVPCPGETIREVLNDLNFSQVELSRRMKRSQKFVNQLIQGKAPLDEKTALQLERVFSIRAGFWLGLELDYQLFHARQEDEKKLLKLKEWVKEFPFGHMVMFQWIAPQKTIAGKVQALLEFFGIATPDAWDDQWEQEKLCAAFRASNGYTAKAKSVATWLRQGQRSVSTIELPDFDKQKFQSTLIDIRKLTEISNPNEFTSALKNFCTQCGVAVFFVPELPGTTLSGAAHWYGGKPIIQLSFRYKTNDHLWFSFFHEAKHIISHSNKQMYINEKDCESKEEQEANKFARDTLIPEREYRSFLSTWNKPDLLAIKTFANKIGIHPGIVVGRLQHDNFLAYNQGNNLKITYKLTVAEKAPAG